MRTMDVMHDGRKEGEDAAAERVYRIQTYMCVLAQTSSFGLLLFFPEQAAVTNQCLT